MEEKTIVSSATLYERLLEVSKLAKNSIVNLMKSKGVTKVNLMVDQDGRDEKDEDYDADWVEDHRVWIDCYGKYHNELGYVSEVEIDKYDDILLTAEGENDTYPNDYVSHYPNDFVDVLERLETILKQINISCHIS